jgi:HK97 family phage portal protein
MPFPDLVERIRGFASGFQHSQKLDILTCAAEAPPLEVKGSFADFSFDTTLQGVAEYYRRHGYDRLAAALSAGMPGWANEVVTLDTAQNLSSVWACRRIICETLAGLPFQLVQQVNDNELKYRKDLPISEVMKHGNDERSGFGMLETHTAHMLFAGNGYGRIIRRSGGNQTALDIEPILPGNIDPTREADGQRRLKYTVHTPGNSDREYFVTPGQPHDILHLRGAGWDGLIGQSIIAIARQTLSSGLGMEKNWGRFLANGGRVPFLLKRQQPFTSDAEYEKYREKFRAAYSDPHRPVIMEGQNMEYEQIGVSAKDAQLLESRMFSVIEIGRWFGVSPSLIFALAKGDTASLEQLVRSFINFTLRGWMERWKGDFRRCVLTPAEKKQGIFCRFDLRELNRPDFKDRFSAYGQGLVNGIFSINEAREMEGMQPVPGLDGHNVQLQMIAAQNAGLGLPQNADQMELIDDPENE